MTSPTSTEFADALAARRDGVFAEPELVGLSDTVTRYFRAAIAPRAPLTTAVRLRMRRQIEIGDGCHSTIAVLNPCGAFGGSLALPGACGSTTSRGDPPPN